MRVPGLEVATVVEFQLDVAAARASVEQRLSRSDIPGDVSIVHFAPTLVREVATASSDSAADSFMQYHKRGDSGWLAIDGSGKVIGYCWRLDNRGKSIVRQKIAIPAGYSWFHDEWTAPAWRGRGIQPTLLSMSLREALTQATWPVQGFLTDMEVTNYASQRSSAKVGFAAVSCVTSLRIYRRWFVLRVGAVPEDVRRQTGV